MEPFRILSVTAQEVKMNRLPVTEEEEWRLWVALGQSKGMALDEIVKEALKAGMKGVIYQNEKGKRADAAAEAEN